MKDSKYIPFQLCGLSVLIVFVEAFFIEKFGTYPHYSSGRHANIEELGVLIPFLILILPIFSQQHRKTFWSKKSIILTITVLLVNLVILIIMYANKEYYHWFWIESGHWDRNNCPPIRWDFWNIIGETY